VAQAIAEMRAMGIAVDNSPKDNVCLFVCSILYVWFLFCLFDLE